MAAAITATTDAATATTAAAAQPACSIGYFAQIMVGCMLRFLFSLLPNYYYRKGGTGAPPKDPHRYFTVIGIRKSPTRLP